MASINDWIHNMRRKIGLAILLLLMCAVDFSFCFAQDLEIFLKNIKDASPEIRVKAIQKLCAG